MGTVAYMSPEQARGEELDPRTDLFSFGAVLYEMATGKQAFSGNTTAVIHEAILNRMPASPLRLNLELPPELARIINKALEKDREVRYQVSSELRADLKRLKRDTESGRTTTSAGVAEKVEVPAARQRPQWLKWAAALISAAVIVAAVLAYLAIRPLPQPKVLGSRQVTTDSRRKFGLVTDGSRLYFNGELASSYALYQVSSSGGETAQVPTPFQIPVLSDISPDGSELLVFNVNLTGPRPASTLWILPVLGGSPRRFGDFLAQSAAWSPNGQQIAYASGPDLYLVKPDGTESRKLVTANGEVSDLRWSPDGSRLRFTEQDPTGSTSLWEVATNGSHLQPLLPGWNSPPEECCGNWTPDGKYYVFESLRNGKRNVWAMREKKRLFQETNFGPMQLTAGPMDLGVPLPSRDGKKVFVVGGQARGELVHYDGKSRQFVPYLSGISGDQLDFSRDGKWVAYLTFPDGTLWRSKLDGSERLQLSSPPLQALMPRWSPDGKRIAFYGGSPGKPTKIYVVSADAGSPRQVTRGDRNDADPTWSPDGNSLVFGGLPFSGEATPVGGWSLYHLDLKTNQVSTFASPEGLYSPQWSPSGRHLAALRAGPESLWLFDPATQRWTELAKGPVGFHNWSRDESYIYFDNLVYSKEPIVQRVRVSDGKLERVVGLQSAGRLVSGGIIEPWSGLGPDDSPLVLRDVGTQEIYALDVDLP